MEKFGLLTFVLIIAAGICSRQYVAPVAHLPYTFVMFVVGCIVGEVLERKVEGNRLESPTVRAWYNMSPTVLLYTIIPILVFESALKMDTHIFARIRTQILSLAGPGVLVATVLTAIFTKYVFVAYEWDWPTCLMFGAILSATDPVAVVALLKELGVSERLGTLIEGESLLNDGTAIVIFDVFFEALEKRPCSPSMPQALHIIELIFRLAALGPIVGVIIGFICTSLLGAVLNDPYNEIAITLLACYASFGIAQGVINTSGVLSVVCCGLYMSRYGRGRISADVESALHSFWAVLAHIANTCVFFLAGLIMTVRVFGFRHTHLIHDCFRCGREEDEGRHTGKKTDEAEYLTRCHNPELRDLLYLVILYIALHIIRGIVICIVSPVLWRSTYGFSIKQALIVLYGGLRGAIALALALGIDGTDHIPDRLKQRLLFQVSGIVFLTLAINGTTTSYLLRLLKLNTASEAESTIFAHVTVDAELKLNQEINSNLKREQFFGDSDWSMVWRYVPCLSADAYWHRIRDHRLELSAAEFDDLRDWSSNNEQMNWWQYFFNTKARKYDLPPMLQRAWVRTHRNYGRQPPKFIHLEDDSKPIQPAYFSTGHIPKKNIYHPTPNRFTFDEILHAVRSARCQHYERQRTFDINGLVDLTARHRHQLSSSRNFSEATDTEDSDHEYPSSPNIISSNEQPVPKRKKINVLSAVAKSWRPRHDWPDVEAGKTAIIREEDPPQEDLDDHDENRMLQCEARTRCLWAVQTGYNAAFARGRLSSQSLRVLRENVDTQLDDCSKQLDGWERILRTEVSQVNILDRLRGMKKYCPYPFSTYLDQWIFRRTAFVFEAAYVFIEAYKDVDIDEIVDDGAAKEALRTEIYNQCNAALHTIHDYIEVFPDVALAVKTQVATRYVLVRFQRILTELHEHGALSETELSRAEERINRARIKLEHHPVTEVVPLLNKILKSSIPFLRHPVPKEIIDRLCEDPSLAGIRSEIIPSHVLLAKRDRKKIEKRGDHIRKSRFGWFVVVRGSVIANFQGIDEDTFNSNEEGILLTQGSVVGLDEQLLGIPFAASYWTLSLVHLIFFDRTALLSLAEKCEPLRRRLWWNTAERVLRESPGHELSRAALSNLFYQAEFIEISESNDLDFSKHNDDEYLSGMSGTRRRTISLTPKTPSFLSGSNNVQNDKGPPDSDTLPRNNSDSQFASPFCLLNDEDLAAQSGEEKATSNDSSEISSRTGMIRTSISNSALKNITISDDDHQLQSQSSGDLLSAAPVKPRTKKWTKVRNIISSVGFMHKKANTTKLAKLIDISTSFTIPDQSTLLLLQGIAFLDTVHHDIDSTHNERHVAFAPDSSEGQSSHDPELDFQIVYAISMITIDDPHCSRTVRLSPGSKAFVIKDSRLGYNIKKEDFKHSISSSK
uniref:Cation/H+ exchanger transmembrane domain-containing protein n=1 Tax=Aureoumbra lagunensis TaxID=44058 RepID=A0A7S3JZM7_9STRA